MSYNDDEELKIGEFEEGAEGEVDDLELGLDEPLVDDDVVATDDSDDDDLSTEFAGLDGSSTDY